MTATPLIPRPNRTLQVLTRFWLRLVVRPFLIHRVRQAVIETTDGLMLVTIPTVFNPVVFRAGVMLGRAAASVGKPGSSNHARALDMGCGTGIVGAYVARNGFNVTSVDINPDAVRIAKANAVLNDLQDKITVLEGDLFMPLNGQKFDLVCFSPPYFKGLPKNDRLSRAFWSQNLMSRFARELPTYLNQGATVLVHLSTDGDSEGFLTPAAEVGFNISIFTRRNYGNEIMTVYLLHLQTQVGE